MRSLTVMIAALTLAGCASDAEIAAKHDATCRSYGAAPGSPQYYDCRMRLNTQLQGANAQAAAEMAEGFKEAGRTMERASEAASQRQPLPPMTTCTGSGNAVHCY